MEPKTEVLVVGGGSTGTSILFGLAKIGITNTILVEKGEQLASGQTARSHAGVRPAVGRESHYTKSTLTQMAKRSYDFFTRFAEEVPGGSCGFRKTGMLVCADSKDEKRVREDSAMFTRNGIEVHLVDKDEAKRIEPQLDPSGFTAMMYEPQAAYCEPSNTANSYARAAQGLGAKVLTNTAVLNIKKASGNRYSVTTSNGTISAEKVVVTTGAWSKPIFHKLGLNLPVKPVRHPFAIYKRPEEFHGLRASIFDLSRDTYYNCSAGKYGLMAGEVDSPEQYAQFEAVNPDNYDQNLSFDDFTAVTGWLSDVIPIMGTKGQFERALSCVYDMTPDAEPIIDEFSELGYEGLYCLVGNSGHGFKLSPEFGRIMAQLVTKGKFTEYDISMFSRKRFEESLISESN